jgi:hypothetical protein
MFGDISNSAKRLAWSLPPSDLETLSKLDAENRIYWVRDRYGVSLQTAFGVVKLLSAGGES